MKKARRPEEQIIGILAEHAAGAKCADLCRKHGMSEGTFYAWKAKYSGMSGHLRKPAQLGFAEGMAGLSQRLSGLFALIFGDRPVTRPRSMPTRRHANAFVLSSQHHRFML
jgi:putative transposase